jgi:hypothetical protein
VALDATRTNRVVTVPNITDVVINGESLGIGGYLDIGIIDTMKDLFVNFIGAVVFSVTGFFYVKSHGKRRTPAQGFVPSPKEADRDYLKQAQECSAAEEAAAASASKADKKPGKKAKSEPPDGGLG